VLVLVLAVLTTAGMLPAVASAESDAPEIVAVYPNPLAHGDAGEYVALSVPPGTNLTTLSLDDGEGRVGLPNGAAGGRVVVTGNRSALPAAIEGRVVVLDEPLALANAGERIVLRRDNRTVDRVVYEDAPEAEIGRPAGGGTQSGGRDGRADTEGGSGVGGQADGEGETSDAALVWRPVGATEFDPLAAGPVAGRAFVLPDAPDVPASVLRSADRRILLAGYTLASERVADALVDARRRGVRVEVLVDGGPVGGLTNRSAAVLDRLAAANVTVSALGGPAARYQFHHAKYAVVDNRALVVTENWKPSGTGGRSSRGWGVVLDDPAVVERLARTFRADADFRDARPWRAIRESVETRDAPPSTGSFPSRFEPARFEADGVQVLAAPDNAAGQVRELIETAEESVRIVQVSIDGPNNTLLAASIDAARRGVEVRILLSSAHYAAEDNRALARNLTALAERESLPLSVRLADPRGRYGKVHAKGVLVDGEHVVVGSLNWNDDAFYENREIAVVLTGEKVAGYYGRVFAADWEGGRRLLAVGLVVLLVIAVAAALLVGSRIRFAN